MSHFRRNKPKTRVRCNICTPFRVGNKKSVFKKKSIGLANLDWRKEVLSSL